MQKIALVDKNNQTNDSVITITKEEEDLIKFMRTHNIDYETLRLYIHKVFIKKNYKVEDYEDITDEDEPGVCVNQRKEEPKAKKYENIADNIKTALIKRFLNASDNNREPVPEINNNNGHAKSSSVVLRKKRFRRKRQMSVQLMQSIPYNVYKNQPLLFDPLLIFTLKETLEVKETTVIENIRTSISQTKPSRFRNNENVSVATSNQNNKQLTSQPKASDENTNTTQRQVTDQSNLSVPNTEKVNGVRKIKPLIHPSKFSCNTNITANNNSMRLSKNMSQHTDISVNDTIQPLQTLSILPSDSTSPINSNWKKQTVSRSTTKRVNALSANESYPPKKNYSLNRTGKSLLGTPDTNMVTMFRNQPPLLQNDYMHQEQMEQPKITNTLRSKTLQMASFSDLHGFSQSASHFPIQDPANSSSNPQRQSSQHNFEQPLPVDQPLYRSETYPPPPLQQVVVANASNMTQSANEPIYQNPGQDVYRSHVYAYPANQAQGNHFGERPHNTVKSQSNRIHISSNKQLRPPYKQPSQMAPKRMFPDQHNNAYRPPYPPYPLIQPRPARPQAYVVPTYNPVNSQQIRMPLNHRHQFPANATRIPTNQTPYHGPGETLNAEIANPQTRIDTHHITHQDTSEIRIQTQATFYHEGLHPNYSNGAWIANPEMQNHQIQHSAEQARPYHGAEGFHYSHDGAWVPNPEPRNYHMQIEHFNHPRPVMQYQQATDGYPAKRMAAAPTYNYESAPYPHPNYAQNPPPPYQVSNSTSQPQWTLPGPDQHQQYGGNQHNPLPPNHHYQGYQYQYN